MINNIVERIINNTLKAIQSLSIHDNSVDVINDLNKIAKALSGKNILILMKKIAQQLKKEVLNRGNWSSNYDLKDYNQLLKYIEMEEPLVQKTSDGNIVIGFGHIPSLNEIKRPADVGYIRDRRTGKIVEIRLEKGNFPYWIAAEFGILGRGEDPPSHLGLPPRKTSTEYAPIKLDSTKPSGKPHFIMVKSFVRQHPGVYPTRLFRGGLWAIYNKQIVINELNNLVNNLARGNNRSKKK